MHGKRFMQQIAVRLRGVWWLVAPVTTVIGFYSVAGFDFVGDARFLILENRYVTDLGLWWETLTRDYFWSSSGNAIPYWRPVTKLSWLLEYQLFGTWAGGYHLVQLAWHIVGVLGVQLLAKRWSKHLTYALVAGLLFGLHPVTIQPVCLTMARSDIVCATCVVWAVIGWWHWRESGRLAWAGVHLLAVILALGSKESAAMLPLLLLAWGLLEGDASRARLRKLLLLAPSWLLAVVYLGVRGAVLQGDGLQLSVEPWRLLAGTVYLQNLLPFRLSSSVRNIAQTEVSDAAFVLVAIATLLVTAALCVWLVRAKDRRGLALVGWIVLGLAPVLVVKAIPVPAIAGKFPLADRWLLHSLAPAMLLLVHFLCLAGGALVLRAVQVVGVLWAVGAVVVLSPVRAEHANERAYLDSEDRLYHATPEAFRTREDRCRYLERQLLRAHLRDDIEQVIRRSRSVIQDCGWSSSVRFNLLAALVRSGRYAEARPLAAELLRNPPADRREHAALYYLCGVVYANGGAPKQAEKLLLEALDLGLRNCNAHLHLARVALMRRQPALAARRLEHAYRCGGSRDPGLLLAAAHLWIRSEQPDRTQGLLSAARQNVRLSVEQQARIRELERMMRQSPSVRNPR